MMKPVSMPDPKQRGRGAEGQTCKRVFNRGGRAVSSAPLLLFSFAVISGSGTGTGAGSVSPTLRMKG
jgi:hypothetical protein